MSLSARRRAIQVQASARYAPVRLVAHAHVIDPLTRETHTTDVREDDLWEALRDGDLKAVVKTFRTGVVLDKVYQPTKQDVLLAKANENPDEDTDVVDALRQTPLTFAILKNRADLVQALLNAGANPNVTLPINPDGTLTLGHPLVSLAIQHCPRAVRPLIEAGAAIDECQEHFGLFPLDVAVRHLQTDAVKALIEGGVDVNAGVKHSPRGQRFQRPIVQVLCRMDQPQALDVLQLLLDAGAQVNNLDELNSNAFHHLITADKGLIERFIAMGLNVNDRDQQGSTPLHRISAYPVAFSSPQRNDQKPTTLAAMIVHIVALGADINAFDRQGHTPLTNIIHRSLLPLAAVEALLLHGADMDAAGGNDVETPRQMLEYKHNHQDPYEGSDDDAVFVSSVKDLFAEADRRNLTSFADVVMVQPSLVRHRRRL